MAYPDSLKRRGFGETSRIDAWWIQPLVVFTGLSCFIVYTTWSAIQGVNYFYDGGGAHYLSPFYSPLLFGQAGEPRWFDATHPSWWPLWLPFSPAFLILMGPAGIRFTCYYYRGAYYKAFWSDPLSCSVGEPRNGYRGEQKLPLLFQNIHRYFVYLAAILVVILTYDAYCALWFRDANGVAHFGVGVGTIVLWVNAILLSGYTFGCHCVRHQIGGHVDILSRMLRVRKACYGCVSALNQRHMLWAWISLVWVALSDVYVRLCCTGIIHDWRIF